MKIRKFKHKKTGHIFEQDGSYYNRPKHEHIPAWLVEGSNDWEEIIEPTKVEKDYEILSYYAKNIAGKGDTYVDSNYIWKQKSPGQWSRFYDNQFHTGPYSTEAITNHNGYGIHSVRRISDGEIFTIGDSVMCANSGNIETLLKIETSKFNDGIYLSTKQYFGCSIMICIKAKQPLFTTEDGVDIFEGDSYSELIIPGFHNKQCIWNILPYQGRNNLIYDQEGNKKHFRLWFSTKEKAQEYIDLHKPKYSLNDVFSVARGYYVVPQSFIDKLKQLNK